MSEPTWDVRPGFTPDEAGRFAFEAWGAMVEALEHVKAMAGDVYLDGHPEWETMVAGAAIALRLARRVTYRGQDPSRYAEHTKLGAGWKDPSKGYGGAK
jgi:hypothetical protein